MLLLCVVSCKNDDNVISPDPSGEQPTTPINFETNFGNAVTAQFLGRIVNRQKEPLQGVTIRIGNTVTTTDILGTFSVSSSEVFERFAYISAEKQGYITGSRALAPSTTSVNRVEIMLLRKNAVATVTSGETAMVNLNDGTQVAFDGNYASQDGTPYNGAVEVVLKHLSPDYANMEAMMPGMLFAQNTSGNAVALETYGMIAVELLSSTGEELQLGEGSTAQITIPVPSSSLNPPATIPLWYFDEEVGYWIEEGEATLQGNMYVGEVSHFTFWNYDYPYPSVNLCITLQDEDGNPLSYTSVDLFSALLNNVGTYGFTDSNGEECGLVPADEELTVTVPNPLCPNELFSTTIGPFATDANVTITIDYNENTTTLQGTFVNCENTNVTDGYVQFIINGESEIIPVTDGTFTYTVSYCGTFPYSLKGVDLASNQVTETITGTLDGTQTIDLGTLSSCTGLVDSDGDGVLDSVEDLNGDGDPTNDDTDMDGIPNYLDTDDDGDGVDTADEDTNGDGDPTNDDLDGDQIPNYLDETMIPDPIAIDGYLIEGTGCDPVVFDLIGAVTEPGVDTVIYEFYLSEADAEAQTNPLSDVYTVTMQALNISDIIFVRVTDLITGEVDILAALLQVSNEDSDEDGLTDCEELTGVDDDSTVLIPNGTGDPNDPNDTNAQDLPTLSITDAAFTENVGNAMIEITLSQPAPPNVAFIFSTVNGTATAPADYTSVEEQVNLEPGQTSVMVSVPIIDDNDDEPMETFTLSITMMTSNISNDPVTGTISIIDND
jgi:hypothetical protein